MGIGDRLTIMNPVQKIKPQQKPPGRNEQSGDMDEEEYQIGGIKVRGQKR